MEKTGREGWTPEERAHYDARAEVEAWDLARKILGPWVESARYIGSDELTLVMEGALVEVEEAANRAQDELERAEMGERIMRERQKKGGSDA